MIGARGISIIVTEDARKKKILGADLETLLQSVEKVLVASGKKVALFDDMEKNRTEILKKIQGPSGGLRAPALVVGDRLMVGFHETMYEDGLSEQKRSG